LPEKYDLDYLVYALTDGDVTKKELIESTMTRNEAVRWMLLKKFEHAE
jgi:hypothetical protein